MRRKLNVGVGSLLVGVLLLILTPAAFGSYHFDRQWGTLGSGAGQFNAPRGIALDSSGSVYVADGDNYRVEKFDSSGNFISAWGWGVDDGMNQYEVCTSSCQAGIRGSGDGQFGNPTGVAIDSSDNVYVGDHAVGERVEKFDSSGNFIANIGGTHVSGAAGLATDPSDNLYVANNGNQTVAKFAPNGSFVTSWGGFGGSDGLFINLFSVVANSAGTVVYVGDGTRIQWFSPSGAFQSKVYGGALSLARDSLDNLYVGGNKVQAADSSGNQLWESRPSTYADTRFNSATGLAFDSSDNLYLVDSGNNRIQRYDLTTAPPDTSVTSGPNGVTNDPAPTFAFTSSDLDTTFECKVDSDAYLPCNLDSFTTQRLAEGTHTFYVRATDSLGHTDPTPASRSFTVKTAEVSRSGSTLVVTAVPGVSDNFKVTRSSGPTLIVQDFKDPPYAGGGVHAGRAAPAPVSARSSAPPGE